MSFNLISILKVLDVLLFCNILFIQKSGNAVSGLPYALASLSFCQSFNLDLLEASATLTLAELWLSLGSNHAKRALSLVHRSLPIILGHGGLELRARANIAVAKCCLSDPSFSGNVTSVSLYSFVKQLPVSYKEVDSCLFCIHGLPPSSIYNW